MHPLPSPCTAVQVAPPPPPPSPLDPPSERDITPCVCLYVPVPSHYLSSLLSLFLFFLSPSLPPLIGVVSMVIEDSVKEYLFVPHHHGNHTHSALPPSLGRRTHFVHPLPSPCTGLLPPLGPSCLTQLWSCSHLERPL